VSIDGPGREQLRTLAARLKDAGDEGKGLRRALMKQMSDAGQSLAREIADPGRLKPYMPDRYAAALAADLSVTTHRLFAGSSPRVSVVAKGREHHRKVAIVEAGLLNHPVFARGVRRRPRRFSPEEYARKLGIPVNLAKGWNWVNGQTAGMRPGFFADPCEAATPQIRGHMLEAMAETARKITDG
jgi:hypothetical protein